MLMNKIFTKTQLKTINKFLENEKEIIEKMLILNKRTSKISKKIILDYSKSISVSARKIDPFILN